MSVYAIYIYMHIYIYIYVCVFGCLCMYVMHVSMHTGSCFVSDFAFSSALRVMTGIATTLDSGRLCLSSVAAVFNSTPGTIASPSLELQLDTTPFC